MKLEGRIKKGETRNPGGMTAEQRAARDLLNADLREPSMYRAWLVAYRDQLEQGNAVILRDYADRTSRPCDCRRCITEQLRSTTPTGAKNA